MGCIQSTEVDPAPTEYSFKVINYRYKGAKPITVFVSDIWETDILDAYLNGRRYIKPFVQDDFCQLEFIILQR